MSAPEVLLDLEQRMTAEPFAIDRATWLLAAETLLHEPDHRAVPLAGEIGIRICQKLYAQARSLDALPLALSVFQKVNSLGGAKLSHLAAVACGLLSSDSADFAGALEFHGQALEIMRSLNDDAGVGRSWNNIGSALCGVGRYELATASFQRALGHFEGIAGPQYGRYCALTNLAQCAVHSEKFDDGISAAMRALREMESGQGEFQVDPFTELLLRRNMIRLSVARGDLDFAAEQVRIAKKLAKQDGGVRASIAAATSEAVVDIASGRIDIAATRLDKCLTAARPVLPALRDTLACMVRADEAVGNSARALIRLQELSDLVHDAGAEAAKAHMAMADWRASLRISEVEPALAQTKARLVRARGPATVPATWPTLIRLAMGNALQIDPSAAHGTRVGALSRLLAQACGLGPIQALEIGLAAQLHDVGIAADHENLIGQLGGTAEGPRAEEDFAHCEAGWRILCEDVHPRVLLARQIARYHHAWVDGSGHPGGLVGRSIPLHARICAVADAYDNIMQWDRSGSAKTIASGLTRLRALSGTRLDPELVDLFADALQDETRNEGIEFEAQPGLNSFYQLINSLSKNRL